MASQSSDQCYYKRYGEMEEEKATWRQKQRLESHSHRLRNTWNQGTGRGEEGFCPGADPVILGFWFPEL